MDPKYKVCDICFKQCEKESRLSLFVGTTEDPCDGVVEVREPFDLCPEHLAQALRVVFLNDNDNCKKLRDFIGKGKNRAVEFNNSRK